MESLYAGVCLLDVPHSLDRVFDYKIPPEFAGRVRPGSFVSVGFGRANEPRAGLVLEVRDTTDAQRLKSIRSVSDEEESMDGEALKLVAYLKEQTLCTTGDAARAMVPSGLTDPDFRNAVREEKYYRLAIPEEEARAILEKKSGTPHKVGSEGQREILAVLLSVGGVCERKQLSALTGADGKKFDALVSRGILVSESRTAWRGLRETGEPSEKREILLSEEQNAAFGTLLSLFHSGEPRAALLHGVTGSGKTSVILKLIDEVLAHGKGAIVLLPEIALTPQSLSIFCSRYGHRVAVMHSGLSAGERCDAYRRVRNGEADVVIGTRSAVFAPVRNLGLIVMDEEQEHTYKSDMSPKYHARDVARWRCAYHSALLLLASATPSLESYEKALAGKYTLLTMQKRYGDAVLPDVEVVDMRKEAGGAENPFSASLATRLAETKSAGEQAILFLNRRGYHHFLTCRDCGSVIRCDNCSVSMTYHTLPGDYERGELICHLCGMRKQVPPVCPSCGSAHLARLGYGTQRIEREISDAFPSIRVLRMDTDTTGSKTSYDRILGSFRRHEADVLLGTQMVTKGHDFPDVTLVGVMNADASLYLGDYRASERTFAMLTQVIGRAGRSAKKGLAVIQTNNPDSDVIRLACQQDYPAFYEREIKLRKLLLFPPFVDIVLLTVSGKEEREVGEIAVGVRKWIETLTQDTYRDVPTVLFGPFEAPVYRAEGRYRMRVVVKCRLNKRSRALFGEVLDATEAGQKRSSAVLSVDFNPSSL